MSTFEVLVRKIDDVRDHPNADRLSIVKILGFEAITQKNEDGSHRFSKGEAVVYVPEDAVLPEDVLRQYGFYDGEKQKGMLAGKAGNRVKAIRLRGVLSQGLVLPTNPNARSSSNPSVARYLAQDDYAYKSVTVGDDVAQFLGITKYEPPVPLGMGGEVTSIHRFALDYDIENAQKFPGFLDEDEVEVTEKLHGTNFRVAYRPSMNLPEIFGGNVAVASKGLGADGFVFKNNRENLGPLWARTPADIKSDRQAAFKYRFAKIAAWFGIKIVKPKTYAKTSLYVRVAFDHDLINKVRIMGESLGKSVDLFGEIFGAGVQDLHYGTTKPDYRAFDIAVDGKFLGADEKSLAFASLGVPRVPVLYRGPWDTKVLEGHRDGKTTLGGKNIREGIVITAVGDQTKRQATETTRLRPILKMVSPAYLTRKGDVTEYT